MKVNILLSTYNGERFLREQLESIQKQTFKDWELLIRDDGSTDGTLEIIENFMDLDSRIRLINPENRQNLGVIKSFYELVKYEQADYYFFSDQDDVWLADKLSLTLARGQQESSDTPFLVYTDLKVVDESLYVMNESMIRSQSHHANTELIQELTENTVTGGTMMINHALAERWIVTDNLLMHDWYLALLATAFGKLIYIDKPTQLYRQHGNNVLGARTWSKRIHNWLTPQRLVAKYWWLIQSSQAQAKHLLELPIDETKRELVEQFTQLLNKTLWERVAMLTKYGFKKNRLFHTLIFRSLIITRFGYRRNE